MNPQGAWIKTLAPEAKPLKVATKTSCEKASESGDRSYLRCLNHEEFIKDVFLDSDTDMMVLSFVPSRRNAEPLTIEEADATRRIIDRMEGSHRLLLHGRVNPNQPGDIEAMDELKERWGVSAWKTYTQWGPDKIGIVNNANLMRRLSQKHRQGGIRDPLRRRHAHWQHQMSLDQSTNQQAMRDHRKNATARSMPFAQQSHGLHHSCHHRGYAGDRENPRASGPAHSRPGAVSRVAGLGPSVPGGLSRQTTPVCGSVGDLARANGQNAERSALSNSGTH